MRQARVFFVKPRLPQSLLPLQELAMNIYRHWDREADALFRRLDPVLWEQSEENPVFFLRRVQEDKLAAAAEDPEFTGRLEKVCRLFQAYLNGSSSGNRELDRTALPPAVAYFSAEFGLAEMLPVYAGGLGLLAGDYLKSASDLGLPLAGVGLFYREGYSRQRIDARGWQQELFPAYDTGDLPLELVHRSDGSLLTVEVDFPDRQVRIQIWRVRVGRVNLYLLDTNHPANWEIDRNITDRLYGGDLEKRIQQEIVLGIGGMRALAALGLDPPVCHMNEGHSAFLSLERIRQLMVRFRTDFSTARELAAGGTIFTTHTPVPAGIDLFPPMLMDKYFTGFYQSLGLSRQEFLSLGRIDPNNQREPFNMAVLALRLAERANGVSRLHGLTARKMWRSVWPDLPVEEVPVTAVTNGVHPVTWIGERMAALFDRYLGASWRENPAAEESWDKIDQIPDDELWRAHEEQKAELIHFCRQKAVSQLTAWDASRTEISNAAKTLDPRALTIGFARRFAEYKRPTLIFHNLDRLMRIMTNPDRPVQIIFSGKAHPGDEEGKKLIQQVVAYARREDLRHRIVFLEDYDIRIARRLIQGVDLWLGNPRRPLEASSTSGMKAILNGVLHISTLDGWWDEAWSPKLGWAIGDRRECPDTALQDKSDAESLYNCLEYEIIPLFYERNAAGLPAAWLSRMRLSIKTFGPRFSAHRMVQEYNRQMYVPACERYADLSADNARRAAELAAWKNRIARVWPELRIEAVEDDGEGRELVAGDVLNVKARIFLGPLSPQEVLVEAYHGTVRDPEEILEAERIPLSLQQDLGSGVYVFGGGIPCRRSGRRGYMIRILPRHKDLGPSLIGGLILWG